MTFFKYLASATVLLLSVGSLCGCGQKGKLIIPITPPAISTPYPVAQPKVEAGETGPAPEGEANTDAAMEATPVPAAEVAPVPDKN